MVVFRSVYILSIDAGVRIEPTIHKKLEVKTVTDIVNQSENASGYQGCNGNKKPCTDIGMKYGIFIGVFPA